MEKIIFISGIGTNVGKSYATAFLGNMLREKGYDVITQKMIQTGNTGYSEDIDLHRRLMNMQHCEDDKNGLTTPIILSYPASPHLAARIDNYTIDMNDVTEATEKLCKKYDIVLLEGAGGIMVPITERYLTIDYACEQNYPMAIVTGGILGSINHTLLTLEAIKSRGLKLKYLIYNRYFDEDSVISKDTVDYLKGYIAEFFPETEFIEMPAVK